MLPAAKASKSRVAGRKPSGFAARQGNQPHALLKFLKQHGGVTGCARKMTDNE
jgi:hypothetical protein